MKDKAKIKELKGIAVDFAYHIHLTKQGDVSHNKHIEIFDEWAESKGIYNRPSFELPTVTDEEIDRRAEKFADDWEELGYSRENAYDYFKSGAKWMQSRLSQPVRECRCHLQSQQTMCNCQSQPVTGYSEEEVRNAIRVHIPDAATVEFHGSKYVGSKIDAIIQSLKSKPNTNTEE